MASVPEPAPRARDWAQETTSLLERLAGEVDRESVDALAALAAGWLAADGKVPSSGAESRERILLARRLGERVGAGTILHLGAHDGGIARALAAGGARVWSFLDHPARAIEATLHHGGPDVHFAVRSDAIAVPAPVDLAVVETANGHAVAPLGVALGDGAALDAVIEGDAVRRLRTRLLSGELDDHCRSCPARGWTDPATLAAKVTHYLAAGVD
jgi:hypothetical protein